MDRIELRGIRAFGRHGANEGERDHDQPFDIDVIVEMDLATAGRSDALTDTLDYAALHRRLVQTVRLTSFALLERLAEELMRAIFDDARVRAARLHISKPYLLDGASPGVRIRRRNPRYMRTKQ